jgi:hypothetical protein
MWLYIYRERERKREREREREEDSGDELLAQGDQTHPNRKKRIHFTFAASEPMRPKTPSPHVYHIYIRAFNWTDQVAVLKRLDSFIPPLKDIYLLLCVCVRDTERERERVNVYLFEL